MNAVMLNCAGKREKQIFEFRRTQASSGLQKSSHSNAEPDGDRATWPVKGQRNQHRVSLFKLFWNRRTGGPLQCWTRSGFRIAIQTGFCNSGQEPDRTGFRKGLYRIRYGYPNHVYHSSQMLKSVFGCKPDWIKCLGSTTGLGSGWITQWNHWTGLRLQKYPIRSTLVLLSHLQQLYGNSDRSSSWHHSDRSGSWHHSDRSGSWHQWPEWQLTPRFGEALPEQKKDDDAARDVGEKASGASLCGHRWWTESPFRTPNLFIFCATDI